MVVFTYLAENTVFHNNENIERLKNEIETSQGDNADLEKEMEIHNLAIAATRRHKTTGKEIAKCKIKDCNLNLVDLPGTYSISAYSPEELYVRRSLVEDVPDVVVNVVDSSNLQRNLYLTTQLLDLGHPVVLAVNMIDLVRKNGDTIDLEKLSRAIGCLCVEISALKGEGCFEAAKKAVELARNHTHAEIPHVYNGSVEHALAHIEESIEGKVDDNYLRWFAIKLFERDERVIKKLGISDQRHFQSLG